MLHRKEDTPPKKQQPKKKKQIMKYKLNKKEKKQKYMQYEIYFFCNLNPDILAHTGLFTDLNKKRSPPKAI